MPLEVPRRNELVPPKSPKMFRTQKELPKGEGEESKIIGQVPSWVAGTFLRVGPGKFDFDKGFAVDHFLDGYGLISKFEIGDGKVRFEKKFLESDAYKKALIAQKPVIQEFGTKSSSDPTKGFFSKMIPTLIPELSDNGNLSLFNIGKGVFTSGETCFFRDLDPSTLETVDKFDTNKYFGLQVASAHPLTDPEDGSTYNVGCSIITGLKYNVVKIPPMEKNQEPKDVFKKAKIICSIPTSNLGLVGFMHSFGLTKNYVILIEQPYVLNASKILGSVLTKTQVSSWLEWKPDLGNRFFIVEKSTGKLLKADVVSEDPFFFLHIINCYEINDHIVIDLTAFPNANSLIHHMNLEKLRRLSLDNTGNDAPCGERYIIPLVDLEECKEGENMVTIKSDATAFRRGKQLVLTSEIVTEKGIELPTINKRFLAKKTSFYYGTGSATKGFFENAISKVHATSKTTILWRESEHYFLSEPMFVNNPNGSSEDDGVLISAVVDNREKTQDFLLFLDAKTMKELGRAYFKEEIPTAVHGLFIPNEKIQSSSNNNGNSSNGNTKK